MKYTLIFSEGTRDSIFIRYVLKMFMDIKNYRFNEKEGYTRISKKLISGAYLIEELTNGRHILLIPSPGITELKKLRDIIIYDVKDESRDSIDVPIIEFNTGESSNSRIAKIDIQAIIFVCDYAEAQDIVDDVSALKEATRTLYIHDKTISGIRIRYVFFKENFEEFLYYEVVKPNNLDIENIVVYLKSQGFPLVKAVKASLFKYCDSIYKQYSRILKDTPNEKLKQLVNTLAKIFLIEPNFEDLL